MARRRSGELCPEPFGFSFAIVAAMPHTEFIGSRECREETHEGADHPGRRNRSGAIRRCRGACRRRTREGNPNTPVAGIVTVKVSNWRLADLVELQMAESGSTNLKKVLGALKAGQWTWAYAPQGKT